MTSRPWLGRDLAIDLGTANTVIHARGRGIVLDEPSVVAFDASTNQLVAAGSQAKAMLGRAPGTLRAVRPLRHGVVTEPDETELMLRWFLDGIARVRLVRPRMVLCVPNRITGVERRALEDAATRSGARRVYLLEEAMAAAVGAGLPVHDSGASMVIDIGAGTTDIAVISLGGIVTASSLRVAGDDIDEAMVAQLKASHRILLGERSSEEIKVAVGSAFPLREELTTRVRGRDLDTGLPKTVEVGSAQVRRAIDPAVGAIVERVKATLDLCPPELAGDVVERGITLTGGGALLRGLDRRLQHELGVPVRVADDASHAVVRGAGQCVDDFASLRPLLAAGEEG